MKVKAFRLSKNTLFLFFIVLLGCIAESSSLFGDSVLKDVHLLPTAKTALTNSESLSQTDFLPLRNQLRIISFLSLISLIPFGVMMMTSFTRISIIFQFLRQALGSTQIPSNQIIIGLSLILTGYIMHPVVTEVQQTAITPYTEGEFAKDPKVISGKASEESILILHAWKPLRNFLLKHVREKDLQLFLEIGQIEQPDQSDRFNFSDSPQSRWETLDNIPWYSIVPAFVLSELRIAFMMGFLLFLPFLIIDMVTSAILMSMGMMMLPPIMVSTPFKLLLFILIDGWRLIIQQIVVGYYLTG
jgi:flagellar biosynthetic protein FliP